MERRENFMITSVKIVKLKEHQSQADTSTISAKFSVSLLLLLTYFICRKFKYKACPSRSGLD